VQVGTLRLEPETPPGHVDNQQRSDLADAGLHGIEPDELSIEVFDDLEDTGVASLGLDVDALGGR